MRPWSLREKTLLLLVAVSTVAVFAPLRPVETREDIPLHRDITGTALSVNECHCGAPGSDISTRHDYRGFVNHKTMPEGFTLENLRLYQMRHANTYVDWWNVDEGRLREVATHGDERVRIAMGRLRTSAQNVALCAAHADTVIGFPSERTVPSPLMERLEAEIDSLGDHLYAQLSPEECWLVVGADLRTGRVVSMIPDTRGEVGLWGGLPLLAIDFHRTAHLFDFGDSMEARREYFDTIWPQINHRAIEGRHSAAIRHVRGRLTIDEQTLVPLSGVELAALNTAALEAVRMSEASAPAPSLEAAVPETLIAGLRDLLGPEWEKVLQRSVALAPTTCVLGYVIETDQLALFHVSDPGQQGVWGVIPIAALTPDQADRLPTLDWNEVEVRWLNL